MPFFDKQLKYVLVLCTSPISLGFVLSYCSPSASSLYPEFGLTSIEQSIFNAIPPIVAILGSQIFNSLANKYGKKLATIFIQIGLVIGWVLIIATNKSYYWLAFIGRVFTGLSIGGISAINPIYINELAPEDCKSTYGVFTQLSVSVGTLITYLSGYTNHWRWIACIALIPSAIFFIFIWFCPDTSKIDHLDDETNDNEDEVKERLFQLKYTKPIIVATLCVIFQQFSGINALLSNLKPIFDRSHITIDSTSASVIVGIAKLISTLIASTVVGKFGNKVCWIASSFGQALFLMLAWANEVFIGSSFIPVLCLFFDILMFGIGLGPIPWYVVVLLFPPSLCSSASSILQSFNYFLCSMMMFTFQPMSDTMTIGWVYFFYSAVMILSTIYGFILLPSGQSKKTDDKIPLSSGDDKSNENI